MAMFDSVSVEADVSLPHFPESLDKTEIGWQSKSFERALAQYKLTADGRLLKKEERHREKTDEEKQAEAEQWGFDSWDAYTTAYDEMDDDSMQFYPDSIEVAEDEKSPPSFHPSEQVLEDTYWADQNYHGSFEFYSSIREDPVSYEEFSKLDGETVERPDEWELDILLSYEARFTEGELQNIVVVGRHDSKEDVLQQLEEWNDG